MSTNKRFVVSAALILLAGLAAAGAIRAAVSPTKTFSTFTIAGAAFNYTDPALAYDGTTWQLNWNVYLGLLGYPHVSGPAGARLVPVLAEKMPTVTADGKQFKFVLRPGLRYSNGAPVKASDFRCTIERLFQIDSPGVGFYESIAGVDGTDGYAASKTGHITGIDTNDKKRLIVVTLAHPEADFLNTIALPFASLVPCGTPPSDQSLTGVPATGPYMIKSYQPTKQLVLGRNPFFSQRKTANIPRGNPDEIVYNVFADDSAAAQQVIDGQADYDASSLPTDWLPMVNSKYGKQLKIANSAVSLWFFLNTRVAPFNNLDARKAVNFAVDRRALVDLLGGLAQPSENILPSTYPQYRQITVYTHDLAKARQLVKMSGTAGMHVTVWGSSSQMSKPAAEYLVDVLNKIGWKADVKILASGVYWSTIGNQATEAQVGTASWGQDYPNPIDWLDVLFNGNRITQVHNNNYGNANFADVNQAIDKLKNSPETTAAQDEAWAAVERSLIVDHAAVVPYASLYTTDFFSARVDLGCFRSQALYGFDMSTICVK